MRIGDIVRATDDSIMIIVDTLRSDYATTYRCVDPLHPAIPARDLPADDLVLLRSPVGDSPERGFSTITVGYAVGTEQHVASIPAFSVILAMRSVIDAGTEVAPFEMPEITSENSRITLKSPLVVPVVAYRDLYISRIDELGAYGVGETLPKAITELQQTILRTLARVVDGLVDPDYGSTFIGFFSPLIEEMKINEMDTDGMDDLEPIVVSRSPLKTWAILGFLAASLLSFIYVMFVVIRYAVRAFARRR